MRPFVARCDVRDLPQRLTWMEVPVSCTRLGIVIKLVSKKVKIHATRPSAVSRWPQGTCHVGSGLILQAL